MRLLLDENLDERLRYSFPRRHQVETVKFRRWAGMLDDQILEMARGQFDVLITGDQKLPAEQTITGSDVAVIVLHGRTNRLEDHLPMIPGILEALETISRGQVEHIYPPDLQ